MFKIRAILFITFIKTSPNKKLLVSCPCTKLFIRLFYFFMYKINVK